MTRAYTGSFNGHFAALVVYVDDIIIAAEYEADVQSIKESFSARLGIKGLGKITLFFRCLGQTGVRRSLVGAAQICQGHAEKVKHGKMRACGHANGNWRSAHQESDSKPFESPTVYLSAAYWPNAQG